MGQRKSRTALPWMLLLLFATVPADALAGGSRGCTSAEIEEPVVLPGGSVHPPGLVTICVTQDYSPVASLHAVRIDGAGVALLASRRGESEGGSVEPPFIMLVRDGRGRLHLAGYATPSRDRMLTYELVDLRSSRRTRTIAGLARGDRATNGPSAVPAVVLAARAD